jgi:hypothetical protein
MWTFLAGVGVGIVIGIIGAIATFVILMRPWGPW